MGAVSALFFVLPAAVSTNVLPAGSASAAGLLIAAALRAGTEQGRFTVAGDPDQVAALILCLPDGLGMPLALDDPSLPAEGTRGALLATLGAILGHKA
jgi:hypothetical protein